MSTQPEKSAGTPGAQPDGDGKPGAAWTSLISAGAVAIVLSIIALELIVIQEIVPPLLIVGVPLVGGIFLMRAKGRPG